MMTWRLWLGGRFALSQLGHPIEDAEEIFLAGFVAPSALDRIGLGGSRMRRRGVAQVIHGWLLHAVEAGGTCGSAPSLLRDAPRWGGDALRMGVN